MDLNWLYSLVKTLALPPGSLVVSGLVGLALGQHWPRAGRWVLGVTIVMLWLMSAPIMAELAARQLETFGPLDGASLASSGAEAIIVLGGGARAAAPEYGDTDYPMRLTLERLRYAAYLQRMSGLPLITSGGRPSGLSESEAQIMRRVLVDEFHADVVAIEDGSLNTEQNARQSGARLRYRRVALVTHALHMPRAVREFERAGFSVVPAPTGFVARRRREATSSYVMFDFLPTLTGLMDTHYVVYEALGALWYRWRYD